MSENGEIYTVGKNFTLPPAVTVWTNSTSEVLTHCERWLQVQWELEPQNQEGGVQAPCQHRMRTLVDLSFSTVYHFISKKVFAKVFYRNVDRCYVDKSNTCQDATPSKSRPGWFWSCEACDTHRKKRGHPYTNLFLSDPSSIIVYSCH